MVNITKHNKHSNNGGWNRLYKLGFFYPDLERIREKIKEKIRKIQEKNIEKRTQ